MKRQTPIQTQKETMPPQMSGLLPHVAVRATPDHDMPSNVSAETRFGHDFSRVAVRSLAPIVSHDYLNASCPPRVQAKLKVGQPGDKYEQEADWVADEVMRMPEPQVQRKGCLSCNYMDEEELIQTKPIAERITPLVQKQTEEGLIQIKQITPSIQRQESLGLEEEELIQTKTAGETTPEVTPAISSSIQLLQGGGRPLSGPEQSFFEPRFGADFSDVRIHDDTRAANIARSINARAFTFGRDVVFGAEEYSPDTSSGRKLLAHELTHVVQQRAAPSFQNRSANENCEKHIQSSEVRIGVAGHIVQCYPGDGLGPPGVCSWGKYLGLRGAVEAAKAVVSTLGRCTPVDNCLTLATKIAAVTAEIAARVAIMTICFLGGDRVHREQVGNKVNMLNRCYRFFTASNCPQELLQRAMEAVRRAIEIVVMAVVAIVAVVALIAVIILLVKAIIAAGAVAAVGAAAAAVIVVLMLIRDQISPENPPTA